MRRLRNLLDGLPVEARCRRENPDEPTWGFVEELLAQVVEEVSVLAADRRRKKPRELPRPKPGSAQRSHARNTPSTPTPTSTPTHGGLLAAATGGIAGGRVRADSGG